MTDTTIYGDGEAAAHARELESEVDRLETELDDIRMSVMEAKQLLERGEVEQAKDLLEMASV